ncbi:uncharacterized protein LOC107640443 [Arachis ipaensis]|uniref:uncharacterized protein LOC107640443 n=1 Tax=Arachis ipaensis TaxID=130454 RepID=UPI0007AFBE89|nr:uncharacterized protein LOC107640443 [Arachis ipaensis]
MSMYVNFVKELLSEKRSLKGGQTVVLTKECSVIIQRNMPSKKSDPGSFQIPCTIRNTTFTGALCDLGASINLMPLSVMTKLQIQEVHPTRIALQLADKSIRQAHGVVENVLVKVEKFFLPTDFVILDMEKDENFSIILGRSFLATGRSLIDLEKGELILRVHDEHLVFHVFKATYPSSEEEYCMDIEPTDQILQASPDGIKQKL